MANKSTDRALDYFNENKITIIGADTATQGVPTVAGTEVAVAPAEVVSPEPAQTVKPAEPVDLGRANICSMTLNDPDNAQNMQAPDKGATGDLGYACKSVGNVMSEMTSALNIFGVGEPGNDDSAMKAPAPPQQAFKPTAFGI